MILGSMELLVIAVISWDVFSVKLAGQYLAQI